MDMDMESKKICSFLIENFQISKARKIKKVFEVIKKLAEKDDFFVTAILELNSATNTEKKKMCEYMFNIYNSALHDGISLEAYILLMIFAE